MRTQQHPFKLCAGSREACFPEEAKGGFCQQNRTGHTYHYLTLDGLIYESSYSQPFYFSMSNIQLKKEVLHFHPVGC